MTSLMVRQGEPQGMLGWPKSPKPLTNQNLRLCVKCDARGRSKLDLSHRSLNHIPQQVFQFQQLDVLILSHNHLDQLPPMISYLRGIRTLDLSHNLLATLPPTLVNCRHLSELDLTHNRLVALPKGVGGLRGLRVLKLGENQLEQVPHELGSLGNLRVLDLHSNKLWYIPFSFQSLYHLLRLDLSDNLLDQVPMVVTKLTWLRALNVSRNRLATLPPDFDQMRELRELNLSENRFVTLGVMATKLRQLKYLSLSHNRLQHLPDQVSRLKNLRVLHLKDNALESLPDDFQHLKYLNISENKLKHFSVQRMCELTALDASGNQLDTLPRGLFKLKHVQRLNLARNNIREVPEDIGWLKKLQSLDLSENDLRFLPASLHFLEKLTSLNIRGNHKLSRVTSQDGQSTEIMIPKGKAASRPLRRKAEKAKHKRDKFLRQYSSMPSLQPPPSTRKETLSNPALKSKSSADWFNSPPQEPTWLDNFLLSKPQRRASWDANMTLRAARSIPYPMDERYDTGEIHASFSEESLNDNDKRFHFDPFTTMSCHSDNDDDDDDSALEASYTSSDFNTQGNEFLNEDSKAWQMDHKTQRKKTSKRSTSRANNKPVMITDVDNQTLKKTPYNSHHTEKKAGKNSNSYDLTGGRPDSRANLGIYNYHDSEASSWEPRQMNLLRTNESRPNSQPGTLRRRPSSNKGTQILHSDSNWTMRSNSQEPLTVQTWTQTSPVFGQTNNHGTQTRSATPGMTEGEESSNNAFGFSGLRSPDSPPMLASMRDRQRHLGSKLSVWGGPSPFHPSPAPSSFIPPASDTRANFGSGNNVGAQAGHTDAGTRTNGHAVKNATDYTLLGVCNQIQTLLHKDLLQPVIGYTGQHNGRFSNKTIRRGENGAWHLSGQNQSPTREVWPEKEGAWPDRGGVWPDVEAGLEYSPGETFTSTERGGHYASAFCPHVQVSVPPGAVDHTLHVTLQQLTISPRVLKAISEADSYVSNLLSIGPIVFLNALEKVTFASPVTLTLPAPPKVKGHGGHLVVVSVRGDSTCVPCTTGYQSSKSEVTLTTWHMTGKVAVLSKARCKYKACKSVEQLLITLNILASKANQLQQY